MKQQATGQGQTMNTLLTQKSTPSETPKSSTVLRRHRSGVLQRLNAETHEFICNVAEAPSPFIIT